MKKRTPLLFLLPLLLLAFPSPSHAVVELGVGYGLVSFDNDLDGVDTDMGTTIEGTFGSGGIRLMVAMQDSSHDQGDYNAVMGGPAWVMDMGGFSTRIYALISAHEFENIDGAGVTLGGGFGWPIFPSASLGFDLRISRWDGGGGYKDVGTGTLQVLFRIGF
ncbi:MAG: hypothetical protein RRA15_03620 [bacterium]|nr:hypothetical protein [bacterium]MDT8365564.1 hypothetical protein [bacterium]